LAKLESIKQLLSGSMNPGGVFDCIEYDRAFRKAHPGFFPYNGLCIFCGAQGSGKTLSMVQAALKLAQEFPALIIVSNVELRNFPNPERIFPYTGDADLEKYSNGYEGVLFIIDEIHTLYNSLQSKNIDPAVMSQICQQRKQRKMIMGTSQVFGRIAKPFREQFKYAVVCSNILKYIQWNGVIRGDKVVDCGDGSVDAVVEFHRLWFHSPALYDLYDTYAVVKRPEKKGLVKKHG
jgi:hypothetical protein